MLMFTLIVSIIHAAVLPSHALLELFTQRQNPTFGELSFQKGKATEKIRFGASTELFAIGFQVPAKLLPEPYCTLFKDLEVIQVYMGNSKPLDKLSQFGSFLIMTHPESGAVELKVPNKGAKGFMDAIYIQIKSPKTLASITDEEALKTTLFAKEGKATLLKKIGGETLRVPFSDKPLQFLKERIRLELNSNLGTPFSPDTAQVSGVLEFALFIPKAKETEQFMKEVLRESIRTPIPSVEDSGK